MQLITDQHLGSGLVANDTALRIVNVSKSYGSFNAVDDISIDVKRNELVTLLGPSGCGKTTTLRMVAGFVFPTSGQIFIDGEDVTFMPPHQREIGLVFQSYSLFPHLTVADNVAYGLVRRRVPKEERTQRVKAALEMVDLANLMGRYPSELSGGQQQRVALARAIVIRPRILLLDEPLSALDAKLRHRMRVEIRQLQQEIGMTTILVTHDQEEALTMSDNVVVMKGGRIEQIGGPADVYLNPRSEFVASFVGETNMLSGRVVGPAPTAGFVTVEIADGFICCIQDKRGLRAGQKVVVSIRPETIAPQPESGSTPNRVRGEVTQIGYLGARTQVQIDAQGIRLTMSVPNNLSDEPLAGLGLSRGDGITVGWGSAACQLVTVD